MKKINLVIPAKEDLNNLPIIINPLLKKKFINKIILVLHRKDNRKILKHKKLTIIVQKKDGYGSAITEGFKISKSVYTCIFNADGSFNSKDLHRMSKLSQKNDFIFASRYLNNGSSEDDNLITLIGNYIFSFLGRNLLNVKLNDILYTYVLCNTKKFNKLNMLNKDFRFCVELPYKVAKYNYNYTEIGSKEFKRKFGKKNVNEIKDGFLILIEVIRCFLKKILKI